MTRLERLHAAKSLSDLAKILNYTPEGLAFVIYKKPKEARYSTFDVRKSSGGVRTIEAPEPQLKLLQSRLADLLNECLEHIEADKPDRRKVSHGFHAGRSIITNAKAHRARKFVLNLDLKDFFGTINFGRIRGYFIRDRNFQLDPKVATIIAQIACNNNALPQGAPSSPVISNLIGHILDVSLIRLARDNGCMYTRYADDLTFSTSKRKFPRQLARPSLINSRRWVIGKRLKDAIKKAGFSINPMKTRMQIRGSRQEITGLIVNEKVNVRQEYYRRTRSMCFSLFHTGGYFINNPADADGSEEPELIGNLDRLEGRLAHIYHIKARRDLSRRDKKQSNFKPPEAPEKLYFHFLFFKYFIVPDRPILVTEGKTDIVYLKAAIKSLHAKYPGLVREEGDQIELTVGFLNPTKVNQDVLNLGTGYTGMSAIIDRFKSLLKQYRYLPLRYPVIFIVDYDKGGENVLKAANKISEQDIKLNSVETFFHVHSNLYLVKTAPGTDGGLSPIEGCFPEETLNQELDGKHFDIQRKHEDKNTFGKHVFAEKIVRPNAEKIDFSGFSVILDGICDAIKDYRSRVANEEADEVSANPA